MSTIDPITHQILRHRLWAINVEAAIALQRVSGSPLATEAFDMNTSIMTAAGDVVFVGPYLLTGSMSQGMIARRILADYADNPGIGPDDVFLCNDPYSGSVHQNCVTLVGPITVEGKIVAWAGATLHVVDVGGPSAGQVGVGARSIFEEAPVTPPLKIFAEGRILRDAEADYLRRSRTPDLNALDLRAKLAAISTIRRRVIELMARYGVDAATRSMDLTISDAVSRLRGRLGQLPDITASHTAYLDEQSGGQTTYYAVRCTLEKRGAQLVLDFSASSPQAGAVINCTESGLRSGALIAVLVSLAQAEDWCPAAIERVVEIVSSKGTVVDAAWPGGCSMATMAGGFATTTAAAVCLAKLLAASNGHDQAMATWTGATGAVDVFGTDQRGDSFGTVLLDSMAGGTGARDWKDGIDTGGFLRSMACVIANVEQYEARYPVMYLYRRQEVDTGGPGAFRGGTGIGYAISCHRVDQLGRVNPHFSGSDESESVGMAGGYPGGANRVAVVRNSTLRAVMRDGQLPDGSTGDGGRRRSLPGVAVLTLTPDDVLTVSASGGGGWGDPIERDPADVATDVRSQLVSRRWAGRVYGVALRADGEPDSRRTAMRRDGIRETRRRAAARSLDEADTIRNQLGGVDRLRCLGCDDAGRPQAPIAVASRPLGDSGPRAGRAGAFRLLEAYCSRCWRLLQADRAPSKKAVVR
jgi:N-methylhydantoinase B